MKKNTLVFKMILQECKQEGPCKWRFFYHNHYIPSGLDAVKRNISEIAR